MALELRDFSFVTVMDVEVYPELDVDSASFDWSGVESDKIAQLDSLTISNITQEGPEKETRGGIHSEPIVRFRKTVRLEMEDVVARIDAFDALFGANLKYDDSETDVLVGFGITDTFAKHLTLRGKTFVIDRETGRRQWVEIVFKRFLPDSIFDMMMEAEGDIGMINVAGELFPDDCGEYLTVTRIANDECADEDNYLTTTSTTTSTTQE